MDSIDGSVNRLLLSSLVVSLIALAGCGVVRDDIAATVNGHEITVAEVRMLSSTKEVKQPSAQDPTANPEDRRGTIAGSVARKAVLYLVQQQLLAGALAALGGTVTAQDRSDAAKQAATVSQNAKAFASGYIALQTALERVTKAGFPAPDDAAVAAYFNQHVADFRQTCIDVLAVQPTTVDAARLALHSGTSFAAYFAAHPDTTQAISQNGVSVCLSAGDTQNAQILQLIAPMAIGTVNETETQAGGPIAFIKVTSRTAGSLTDPAVVTQIKTAIEQTTTSAVTNKMQSELLAQQARAVVKIDPRFGTWDPKGADPILAPPVPVEHRTATTVPSLIPAN